MNDVERLCEQVLKLKEQIPDMVKAAYIEGVTDAVDSTDKAKADELALELYMISNVKIELDKFTELLSE